MTLYSREQRREDSEAREQDRERREAHGPLRNEGLLAELEAGANVEKPRVSMMPDIRRAFRSLYEGEERS